MFFVPAVPIGNGIGYAYVFEDFALDGNRAGQTNTSAHCFDVQTKNWIVFSRLWIHDCKGNGIHMPLNGTGSASWIEDCGILYNDGHGIYFRGFDLGIISSRIGFAGGDGVRVEHPASTLRLQGNDIFYNAGYGLYFSTPVNGVLRSELNEFDINALGGMYINGPNAIISTNTFLNNAQLAANVTSDIVLDDYNPYNGGPVIASAILQGNNHWSSPFRVGYIPKYLYYYVNYTLSNSLPLYAPPPVSTFNARYDAFGLAVSNLPQLVEPAFYRLNRTDTMMNQRKLVNAGTAAFAARATPSNTNYLYSKACDTPSENACALGVDGTATNADMSLQAKGNGSVRGYIDDKRLFQIEGRDTWGEKNVQLYVQVADSYVYITPSTNASACDMYVAAAGTGNAYVVAGTQYQVNVGGTSVFVCQSSFCGTSNSRALFQGANQVIDTLTAGSGITITGSGNSRTIARGPSTGTTPAIVFGTGACTGGGTAPVSLVTGAPLDFMLTFNTGTGTCGGGGVGDAIVATITLNASFPTKAVCSLTDALANQGAGGGHVNAYIYCGTSTCELHTFSTDTNTNIFNALTQYSWNVRCGGY